MGMAGWIDDLLFNLYVGWQAEVMNECYVEDASDVRNYRLNFPRERKDCVKERLFNLLEGFRECASLSLPSNVLKEGGAFREANE